MLRTGSNAVATSVPIATWININKGSFAYMKTYLVILLISGVPSVGMIVPPFHFLGLGLGTSVETLLTEGQTEPSTMNGEQKQEGPANESKLPAQPETTEEESWKRQFEKFYHETLPALRDYLGFGWFYIIQCLVLGTQLWVYFWGLHRGYHPTYKAEVFFFANINMFNSYFVRFWRFNTVCGVILAAGSLILGILLFIAGGVPAALDLDDGNGGDDKKQLQATPKDKSPKKQSEAELMAALLVADEELQKSLMQRQVAIIFTIFGLLIALVVLALSITFIERTLAINAIDL
jgi:hypothetical protein